MAHVSCLCSMCKIALKAAPACSLSEGHLNVYGMAVRGPSAVWLLACPYTLLVGQFAGACAESHRWVSGGYVCLEGVWLGDSDVHGETDK